jgi:hypothetical protein
MRDLSPEFFTLVAVLIGGVTSYVGGAMMERSRWKRERSARWDQNRFNSYVDFAQAVKDESRIAMRIAAGRKAGPATDPLDLEEGKRLYVVAEHKRSTLFEAVLLLGDTASIEAGRQWAHATWNVYLYVSKKTPPTTARFHELYKVAGVAREAFYAASRSSLEIRSVDHSPTANVDSTAPKF